MYFRFCPKSRGRKLEEVERRKLLRSRVHTRCLSQSPKRVNSCPRPLPSNKAAANRLSEASLRWRLLLNPSMCRFNANSRKIPRYAHKHVPHSALAFYRSWSHPFAHHPIHVAQPALELLKRGTCRIYSEILQQGMDLQNVGRRTCHGFDAWNEP